ncbi:MAG: hypothetical protein ABIU95_04475 [Burkholderiales bacterium]
MSKSAIGKLRTFDLPPLRLDPKPAFIDATSCRKWLDEVPLLNVGAANGMLYAQLELFTNFEVAPEKRFETLELMRPHLFTVQEEHSKKFRSKPSPLSPQRREILSEVNSLWDVFGRAYQRCVEAWGKTDGDTSNAQAAACQRALDCVARKVLEHHYAYVKAQPADFRTMHKLFAYSERENLLGKRVRDPLTRDKEAITIQRTYLRALLFDAATPREHRGLALSVLERWLDRWGGKVTINADLPATLQSPPLFVDLTKDGGLSRDPERGPTIRVIDLSGLAISIDKRINGLRHGKKPEELDLGNDLSKRDFEGLLVSLRRQWCEGRPRRQHDRQPVERLAHASTGLVAAHFYLGKRPFEQPFTRSTLPRPAASATDPVTQQRVRAAADYMLLSNIHAEQWIIRDESVTGLGLIRPLDESDGSRLTHGMMVSVRPRGGGTVLVGTIQWLEESAEGDLHVGVRLIPGVPMPTAARYIGQEKFFPALMLAPIPAMNAPSSILLPAGSYAPQKVIEIFLKGIDRIQLTGLLDAGADFERVAFMPGGAGYVAP